MMMTAPLQSHYVRYMFTLFIFLLSHHLISADLVVRDNLDIEQYLTPRLFSPREKAISSSNFTFQLQERSLAQRQNYVCDPGYGYCSANGACCPDSDRCCENSCTKPGGACCANGRSCRAGYGCCDLLNIGNDDCVPLGSSCCRGGGFCKAGWGCCNDSIDGCAPLDGECCIGYGYCTKGYQCVLHRGLLSCCPGGICFGSDNDNGQTLTSQPPSEGDSADEPAPTDTTEETEIAHDDAIDDLLTSAQANEPSPTQPPADSAEAPIPTEEPRATLEQTETVKDITNKYLSISVQGDETSSTTNSRFDQPLALPSFPFPSSELAFLSSELAFLSISIPSISVPSVNVPSISVPSISIPSPQTPIPTRTREPSTSAATGVEEAAPASMGSPKIQTASWAAVMTGVVAVFFVVGATLGI